jgi:hypothetical protein
MKNTNLIPWVLAGLLSTVVIGTGYGMVQHTLRSGANDPQIQMVEEAVTALQAGERPETVVGTTEVNLDQSSAPFLIVYNESYGIAASGAKLSGSDLVIPQGVLVYAREHGTNAITWQPKADTRLATVAMATTGDHPLYVVAARSLRHVEQRESETLALAGIGWLISLGLIGITYLVRRPARTE